MALSARMPELSAFEIFVAIARTGSLGAASREFGLTQQAVSARIASMEAQTGVGLVVRTPRGSRLTPAGVVVAEWADRLLGVAQHVDAGLAALRSERRKRIKVVASLTVAEQLMPRWLVSLQAAAHRRGATAPDVIMTATNSDHAIAAVREATRISVSSRRRTCRVDYAVVWSGATSLWLLCLPITSGVVAHDR